MKEILRKLNSIKLTLMAHPDYAMNDGGEFHDQVETIEDIETELKNIAVLDDVSEIIIEECVPLSSLKRMDIWTLVLSR